MAPTAIGTLGSTSPVSRSVTETAWSGCPSFGNRLVTTPAHATGRERASCLAIRKTLSNSSAALGCSLGDLIERDGPQLLRSGEGIWVEGPATHGRLIARLFGSRGVDVHEVQFKPHVAHQDRPLPGTIEHVYVVEGDLRVESGGDGVDLHPGDIMRFPSGEPYSIMAGSGGAKSLFFINSGDIGPREIAESGVGGTGRRPR